MVSNHDVRIFDARITCGTHKVDILETVDKIYIISNTTMKNTKMGKFMTSLLDNSQNGKIEDTDLATRYEEAVGHITNNILKRNLGMNKACKKFIFETMFNFNFAMRKQDEPFFLIYLSSKLWVLAFLLSFLSGKDEIHQYWMHCKSERQFKKDLCMFMILRYDQTPVTPEERNEMRKVCDAYDDLLKDLKTDAVFTTMKDVIKIRCIKEGAGFKKRLEEQVDTYMFAGIDEGMIEEEEEEEDDDDNYDYTDEEDDLIESLAKERACHDVYNCIDSNNGLASVMLEDIIKRLEVTDEEFDEKKQAWIDKDVAEIAIIDAISDIANKVLSSVRSFAYPACISPDPGPDIIMLHNMLLMVPFLINTENELFDRLICLYMGPRDAYLSMAQISIVMRRFSETHLKMLQHNIDLIHSKTFNNDCLNVKRE